jgi:hypothetical protein
MALSDTKEHDLQETSFSDHPGHGDPRRTVAEFNPTMKGNEGARNKLGLSGNLKYKPTASD